MDRATRMFRDGRAENSSNLQSFSPDRTLRRLRSAIRSVSAAIRTPNASIGREALTSGTTLPARRCHTIHAVNDPVLAKLTEVNVCFRCHTQQRAESFEYSHHPMREGEVVCSDCHNPHGSAGPDQLKEFTVNETCYNCHADKRGPMLWEHQPVRESCVNCHTPHGSVEASLLKERQDFMCSSCHSAVSNRSGGAFGGAHSLPGNLEGTAVFNASLANNRLCLNCHSQVHGSNSPNGAYFLR